jgi:hypothetical protein
MVHEIVYQYEYADVIYLEGSQLHQPLIGRPTLEGGIQLVAIDWESRV